jgi:hypothetical protein
LKTGTFSGDMQILWCLWLLDFLHYASALIKPG